MGLSLAKCVSIGPQAAVNGLVTFGFATAAPSSCTICQQHPPAAYVTVATAEKVSRFIDFKLICSNMFQIGWTYSSAQRSIPSSLNPIKAPLKNERYEISILH